VRRFLGLLVVLFFSLPFSVAVVGCHHALAPTFCPGFSDSGPVAGQVTTIAFGGGLTTSGESLNYGQIGNSLSATATDCFGSSVAAPTFTFGTTNMQFADINPTTGQVCAGTWNRNVGGGVPDYSVCTPPSASVTGSNSAPQVAYVTASADGVSSNPIPVYIHPVVTSIVVGSATPTTSCAAAVANPNGDPSSNCCPANSSLIANVPAYDQMSCVSQNRTAQLTARVYSSGDTSPVHNITCQVGHVTYTPQSASNVVSIDANGIATANLPGSTTILASVSNSGSGSTAGFFSTCPPVSISLTSNGSTNPVSVALNNAQPLTTVVKDQNGVVLSGLTLEFVSTSPQTVSAGSNSVTPNFPGTATLSAICQPGGCNPSPFSQIGYLSNGKPITSNGLTINSSGTSSNQVIVASTNSLFFYSVDFTTGSTGAVYKLPYQPNSMVITQDGATLYFGSANVLMSAPTSNGNAAAVAQVPGVVLAVSPDSSTLVIADSTRGTTSLYSTNGTLQTTYAGVGTRAQWTPDSTTVYIAAGNTMLVHSSFSGWTSTPVSPAYQDVAVAVPSYGAYFAAGTQVQGRTYCATSNGTTPSSPPPAVSNTFFPLAETENVPVQRLAATSDGAHILGLGSNGATPNLYDLVIAPPTIPSDPRLACTTATGPVTLYHSGDQHAQWRDPGVELEHRVHHLQRAFQCDGGRHPALLQPGLWNGQLPAAERHSDCPGYGCV
jgi:trimeric autotransporter adhesin